jgi:type I restriction enzyme S subunit
LDKSKCLPEFLHAYFLHDPDAREFLARQASGSIMDGLNMGIIKAMPLRLPPLAQQREVIARFNAARDGIEAIECVNRKKLTAANELKKSLLHHAFARRLPEGRGR